MTRKSQLPIYGAGSGGICLNNQSQDDDEFIDGLKAARWELFKSNNRDICSIELRDKFNKYFGYINGVRTK